MDKELKTIKFILGIFLVVLLTYLIGVFSSIVIPLTVAIFVGLLLQPILEWFKSKKVPYAISLLLVLVIFFLVITGIGRVISSTGQAFYAEKDELAVQINYKLQGLKDLLQKIPGVDMEDRTVKEVFNDFISMEWILRSTTSIAGTIGDFTGALFMTLIYLVAVLGGILNYKKYLSYLSGKSITDSQMVKSFEKVQTSLISYLKVKTLVSLGTGIGFWLVCMLFGIKFAIFWGFLAFLLNFIPTFGSIVATIPPALMGIIQLSGFGELIFFLLLLAAVQVIFGNIIEPKVMGSTLALNTVTVILGLVFWGYLWGAVGMILSVPLMVLIKIVLTQIPDAQFFVRLMGEPEKSD